MRRIVLAAVMMILHSLFFTLNTTAQTPKVVTNPRFARGATMAFGRIKTADKNGGTVIAKRGFCIAENPNPTIDDSISTKKLYTTTKGDTIYYFENLKPSTKYYMRAYATNQDGVTGYGDAIKFYTIPMGDVTCWYNNGGDEAANTRINNAITQACSIFSNLTSTKKHFSMGYSSGTPTADCYYADEPWINMGANSSYQRCGTIMHEMEHGLGVIPYTTQWNKNILREKLDNEGRGSGNWLGERASEFLNFWDNTTGSYLQGDYQHFWPYGINGAHEDDGSLRTYYANALICQALGEDGLQHRYSTFADPCYIFDQEDDIKYYIKNESEDRGRYTSYLVPNSSGTLKWVSMTTDEAAADDNAAWYITFTPSNQYYQFRNAATGQYISYSTTFKTVAKETTTSAEDFHLLKGRVDVNGQRGYWLIHPEANWEPKCIQANTSNAVGATTFNIENSAERQRWLIITLDEARALDAKAVVEMNKTLTKELANATALIETPHTAQKEDGDLTVIDSELQTLITSITEAKASYTTPTEVTTAKDELKAAMIQFLGETKVTDISKPFDLTFLINNQGFDSNSDGWSIAATNANSCCEFFEKTFDFYQTTADKLPAGTFELKVQAFQRPGSKEDTYTDFVTNGNDNVNAFIYLKTVINKTLIKNIWADAQTKTLGGATYKNGGLYIPNNMLAASQWFSKGWYENSVMVTQNSKAVLKMGIKGTKGDTGFWTCVDNFRLYYYGNISQEEIISGVHSIDNGQWTINNDVYDLSGRRVSVPSVSSARSVLPKGIYIKNGKKILIKQSFTLHH